MIHINGIIPFFYEKKILFKVILKCLTAKNRFVIKCDDSAILKKGKIILINCHAIAQR